MDKQMFVRILNSEMELATGCTEPGAVALTAAEAGGGPEPEYGEITRGDLMAALPATARIQLVSTTAER